jgi:hypothetical protein
MQRPGWSAGPRERGTASAKALLERMRRTVDDLYAMRDQLVREQRAVLRDRGTKGSRRLSRGSCRRDEIGKRECPVDTVDKSCR